VCGRRLRLAVAEETPGLLKLHFDLRAIINLPV
jgi:hypothetical protein